MSAAEIVHAELTVRRWARPPGLAVSSAPTDRGTLLVTLTSLEHLRSITYECVEPLDGRSLHEVLSLVAGLIRGRSPRPVVPTRGMGRDS